MPLNLTQPGFVAPGMCRRAVVTCDEHVRSGQFKECLYYVEEAIPQDPYAHDV